MGYVLYICSLISYVIFIILDIIIKQKTVYLDDIITKIIAEFFDINQSSFSIYILYYFFYKLLIIC